LYSSGLQQRRDGAKGNSEDEDMDSEEEEDMGE